MKALERAFSWPSAKTLDSRCVCPWVAGSPGIATATRSSRRRSPWPRRDAPHALLGLYHRKVWQLVQRLSVSDRLGGVPDVLRQSLERDKPLLPRLVEINRKRDQHEPLRLKLTFITGRLEATRREIASRDSVKPERVSGAYASAEEF